MQIKMQYGETPDLLDHAKWDFSFVGTAIDERGTKSIEYIEANSTNKILFNYIPKEFKIVLGANTFDKDDIDANLLKTVKGNVLVDSTTLNFAEILILCQSLKNIGIINVSILYIEPGDYNRKQKDSILHKRDFELSGEIIGYEAIPGHALSLTNEVYQKVVFLCGFESERIDRALEDSEILNSNCCCIFGVPAFSPGWEMDSFDNNISVLKERKISGGVNFCGATNPLSVYQKLEEIYSGLDADNQMFVVPLATKPMNIGACLFLLSKPKDKVAVLYDHPTEMKGRALKISNWHLFNITFS